MSTSGVALTWVQDLALGLVEPHEVPLNGSLPSSALTTPLGLGSPPQSINHPPWLGVTSKRAEGALGPTIYVVDEDMEQYWS